MARVERRDVALPVQLRADGDESTVANRLVGYAAKFGVESAPLFDFIVSRSDPFVEVIQAGAFTRTLRENPDIRALYNHDTSTVLGRTKAGTLRLREDSTGLAFEVDLPDTQAARDVREMVKRGDIDGCSFGFMVRKDSIVKRPDGTIVRTLLDVDLIEISPAVAFPAYDATQVAVRRKAGQPAGTATRLDLARRRLRLLDL